MVRTVEVEIDEVGAIHPVQSDEKLPAGRAILTWPAAETAMGLIMSEKSLSDWLQPEEDKAWAYLQPEK